MFYDCHAHLDMLEEDELKYALTKAQQKNVLKIISCATSFPSNEKNLELTKVHPEIKAGIGLYPLDAIELTELELDKAFYFFETEIKNAIAVGEVGLDFKYSTNETEQQKQIGIFKRFISLAKKHDQPLIVHSRFAQKQVLQILLENKADKILLHSFTDSLKLIKQAVQKGYFVSTGMNTLTTPETQKNIKEIPLENLLFETDSPIRFNGEKALPEKILLIAQKVAELKQLSLKEIEEQQEKNFKKLFGE